MGNLMLKKRPFWGTVFLKKFYLLSFFLNKLSTKALDSVNPNQNIIIKRVLNLDNNIVIKIE